jgi:hypothetical protein
MYSNYYHILLKTNMNVYKGIFNVSILVTDQYGRSSVSPNLYRVSAAGDLYNFQSYAGLFIESCA